MNIYIGISWYYYPKRKGAFYPNHLPTSERLRFYAQHFNTLEINNTFYKVPTLKSVQKRYDQTPEGFAFSLKVPKTITHEKKMIDVAEDIKQFTEIIEKWLREKAKCLLFQMPPSFHYSEENLALVLAIPESPMLRVIEFRHKSWWKKSVVETLKKAWIVFASVSFPGLPEWYVTLPHEYIRLHGVPKLYVTEYGEKGLEPVISHLNDAKPESAYIFFNNTMELASLTDAPLLQKALF